jgi:hypothetical protein
VRERERERERELELNPEFHGLKVGGLYHGGRRGPVVHLLLCCGFTPWDFGVPGIFFFLLSQAIKYCLDDAFIV